MKYMPFYEMASLETLDNKEKSFNRNVSLETSIKDFVDIMSDDESINEKYLANSLRICLKQLGRYVHSIGDLKQLAENVDGFSRLKTGIIYNENRKIPRSALKGFGKKKLDYFNAALTKCGIDQIPWVTKKYAPSERVAQKGWDWWANVKV